MSYLELDLSKTSVDANCKQAIISLWFWAGANFGPKSPLFDPPPPPGSLEPPSIDEVGGTIPLFPVVTAIDGVAPLLTFGSATQQNDQYYMKKRRVGYFYGPGTQFVTPSPVPDGPPGVALYDPPPLTPANPPPPPPSFPPGVTPPLAGPGGPVVVSYFPEKYSKGKVPQSYIGVKDGLLNVLLQTADVPEICEGRDFQAADIRYVFQRNAITVSPDGKLVGAFKGLGDQNIFGGNYYEYQDISFMSKNSEAISLGDSQACILHEGWHHVLLSFDLTSCAAKSTGISSGPKADNIAVWSQAWLALDDKNLVQRDLSQYWVGWDNRTTPTVDNPDAEPVSLDDQGVVTAACLGIPGADARGNIPTDMPSGAVEVGSIYAIRPQSPEEIPTLRPGGKNWLFPFFATKQEFKGAPIITIPGLDPGRLPLHDDYPLPNYKCTFSIGIPLKGPLGLPASGIYPNRIAAHNMAELQIWFGKKLDLSDERNRRLFIDVVKDKDGKPVTDPNLGTKMAPVNMSIAEKVLGTPHIRLHKTSKWKKGMNTGSLGVSKDGKTPDPTGQFVPHVDPKTKPTPNVIIKFKPDPFIWKSDE